MEIKAPDLGVDSAEVSEILVNVGDSIAKDDNIVLLESDKAAVEVPSPTAGTVTAITVSVGDQVSEGSLLLELDAHEGQKGQEGQEGQQDQEKQEKTNKTSANASAAAGAREDEVAKDANGAQDTDGAQSMPQTYKLPDLGVDEAQVAEVMVAVGDQVQQDQPILLIESDKASVEVPAPAAGVINDILVAQGDMVANGQAFIIIQSKKEDTKASHANTGTKGDDGKNQANNAKPSSQQATSASSSDQQPNKQPKTQPNKQLRTAQQSKLSEAQVNAKLTDVYAGPAVRKLARQLGIDITKVTGSAINQRIVKEDLFDFHGL